MRRILFVALTVLYPLIVFFGLDHFQPRWLALLLLALALARLGTSRKPSGWAAAAVAAALAVATFLGNASLPLKLYPLAANGAMLFLFATSLVYPPCAVERIARLTWRDLPASAVAYTRKVTAVWCGFFVLNGSLSAATAVWSTDAGWALYNGLVAYVLMGLLFAGEWIVRQRLILRSTDG